MGIAYHKFLISNKILSNEEKPHQSHHQNETHLQLCSSTNQHWLTNWVIHSLNSEILTFMCKNPSIKALSITPKINGDSSSKKSSWTAHSKSFTISVLRKSLPAHWMGILDAFSVMDKPVQEKLSPWLAHKVITSTEALFHD